jgi:hypothetical protein
MEISGNIWNYLEISGNIWKYIEIYGNTWKYNVVLIVHICIYLYQSVFESNISSPVKP